MYACDKCGILFDEPDYKEECYEVECGVASLFETRHYHYIAICPECGSEEIDEVFTDEDEL